jgi:hypothetical protein
MPGTPSTAVEVRRQRGERAAHDAALGVAVVKEPRLVHVHVAPIALQHPAAHVHEVHEALLGTVRERREARQILEQ